MRSVNIHEIGSNTREFKDITEMKFDAYTLHDFMTLWSL